jgi:hypothetical protein
MSRRLLILTAVVLLSPTITLAQQSNSTRPDEKTEALKEKAYSLLESLANQISTLQSAENRARIGSNIAGSLWPHDEKRARALFVVVGEDIKLGLKPPDSDNPQDNNTFMVFLQLRSDTIERIAKYDPEFALEFLKTTEPLYEKMPREMKVVERALELRLAKQIASANPDLALKLGRAALAKGPSEELLSLLWKLLRKNKEQGVILYKETVDKVRNVRLINDYQLVNFLFGLAQITPPLADEAAYREFINSLITTALATKCDQEESISDGFYFCSQLGAIMPQMQQVDPLRAAKFGEFVDESGGRYWKSHAYDQLDALVRAGDFDEIFALAENFPEAKASIYWQAFELAQSIGDMERAKKIAESYNGDLEIKRRMMSWVELSKNSAALTEADVQGLLKYVESIQGNMRRFELLMEVAVRLSTNNQTVPAKVLDQATALVDTLQPGKERTTATVNLAMFYALEKNDRGFAIMESLMPKLNEIIDAAIKLDGFDTQYVRDGEWNMSNSGNLGQLLTFLSLNAGYFAWCDFDRAVSMAAQFDRSEIRMMAQLKLAQAILTNPPKRYLIRTQKY